LLYPRSALGLELPRLKVMLVEDNRGDARLIRAMLDEVNHLAVDLVQVDTLRDGLARLEQGDIDVMLLDLGLPDSNGIESFLRVHAAAPMLPVVVLSGDIDTEVALRTVREGAQDYLVKGHVDPEGLARSLRYAIEHKRIAEQQHFLAGASEVLAGTLEYEETVGHVPRLAVPFLATACVLELEGEDRSRPRLLVHDVDVERGHRLREACEALQAVSGARPADFGHDLGFASHLSNGVTARGRLLGTITVLRTVERPPFGPEDVGLLAELAQRSAVAIENARLHRELQVALQLRDEVLATACHDLRSPLSGVSMQVQWLQRVLERQGPDMHERVDQGLEEIDAAVERGLGLVQELLDVAALQAGRELRLTRRRTDLNQLADDVLAQHRLRTTSHQLRLESSPEPLVGCWDPERLARVLDNLLSNAIKYSLEPGVIVIDLDQETEPDGFWAVLRVRDRGIGIPSADLRHVFDRFYRGSNVPKEVRGAGIGLWGVRQIVEQHGGTISVESQEGQGSTFEVRLPLRT
jgi:signal transduction histidine kinase